VETDFKYHFKVWRKRSPALSGIIIANAAIGSLILLGNLLLRFGIDIPDFSAWLALPPEFLMFRYRPWSVVTYMFTHVSFFHFLFNMLWLYWFGIVLLDAHTDRELLQIYLCGGLAGGIFYLSAGNLIAGFPHGAGLCGASAAVMAVMTAAAVRFPDRKFNLFIFGEIKLKWIAVASILLAFLGIGGGGNAGGGIAHAGGVAAGLCHALIKRKPVIVNRREIDPKRVETTFRKAGEELARLDQLLDKVRLSGYASLSKKERDELQYLSTRIKRK